MTGLPDPSLARHSIKADVVFITRELDIEGGRRIWIKFRKAQRRNWGWMSKPVDDTVEKDLYHQKVGLYISQSGKSPIIWVDDKFWKVERRKKLASKPGAINSIYNPIELKIDVRLLNMKESRVQALRKCISELPVL